jgi:hypothetical protein
VFVRASTRRNSAGVPVRYLQLVHNVWDPATGTSKAKVLHSLGREDELDRAAIERLIGSLRRLLHPPGALIPPDPADGAPEGLTFVAAKALSATWALDGIWHALGIDGLLRRLLADSRRDDRVEPGLHPDQRADHRRQGGPGRAADHPAEEGPPDRPRHLTRPPTARMTPAAW